MVVDKVRQVRGLKSILAMLNLKQVCAWPSASSPQPGVLEPSQPLDNERVERGRGQLICTPEIKSDLCSQPHSAHEPRGRAKASLSLANRALLSTDSSTGEQHNPAPIRQVTSASACKEEGVCNIMQLDLILIRRIPRAACHVPSPDMSLIDDLCH